MIPVNPAELFGPVLGRYLTGGCRLVCALDTVAGGVWAELRDTDGLLLQWGSGDSAAEALQDLRRRLDGAR